MRLEGRSGNESLWTNNNFILIGTTQLFFQLISESPVKIKSHSTPIRFLWKQLFCLFALKKSAAGGKY
jgi:hypothetical protein